jgi:hypothetical protein
MDTCNNLFYPNSTGGNPVSESVPMDHKQTFSQSVRVQNLYLFTESGSTEAVAEIMQSRQGAQTGSKPQTGSTAAALANAASSTGKCASRVPNP